MEIFAIQQDRPMYVRKERNVFLRKKKGNLLSAVSMFLYDGNLKIWMAGNIRF